MQFVLERGSIDKPLTFDVGLYNSVFIPVCSSNACKGVFNPNVTLFQSNCARVCTLVLFINYCLMFYMHNNNNYQCKMCWNKTLIFGVGSIQLSFRTIVFTQCMQGVFNPNITTLQSNCANTLVLFILTKIMYYHMQLEYTIDSTVDSRYCDPWIL